MRWSSRAKKQASREYVLEDYSQVHASIFMAGWDEVTQTAGQDIRTGLQLGALDRSKPLYVVERNPEWAELIRKDLLSLGFTNLIVHAGELSKLVIRHKVDFIFIDLLGTLDQAVCEWMRDTLAPALVTNATVALTLAFSRRNNQFMAECERIYERDFAEYTSDLRQKLGVTGPHKLIPILLVRAIFNNHLFAYRQLLKYRDTGFSMLTYKFDGFERKAFSNGSPSLDAIIARLSHEPRQSTSKAAPVVVDLTAERRSRAALKAWETRRREGWVHPAHRPEANQEREHQQYA
jgi:hypothetical protein